MNKLLFNGLSEMKIRWTQFRDKYNEFKFGLSLISQKRYNYYYNVFMISSAAVTTGAYLSFNTVSLNRLKSWANMYEYGDLMKLDEELDRLAISVWNDCNKTLNKSSEKIEFFPAVGCDTISFGSLGLLGAKVGIPHFFTYNTIEDVKTSDVRFKGEHNPLAKWRSESGELFKKCLVMSENAKKFGIAREIYAANNLWLFIDCLNVGIATIVGLGLAQAVLKSPKAISLRSVQGQVVVRLISLVLGFYLWTKLNLMTNYVSSISADKKAIKLGEHYLNGAIEYYSKCKARNAAQIDLMDEYLSKPFTEEGEIRGLILSHLLTYERKINYLKDIKNRLKDENTNNPNK